MKKKQRKQHKQHKHTKNTAYKYVIFPAESHRKLADVVIGQSNDEFSDLCAHVELVAVETQPAT